MSFEIYPGVEALATSHRPFLDLHESQPMPFAQPRQHVQSPRPRSFSPVLLPAMRRRRTLPQPQQFVYQLPDDTFQPPQTNIDTEETHPPVSHFSGPPPSQMDIPQPQPEYISILIVSYELTTDS